MEKWREGGREGTSDLLFSVLLLESRRRLTSTSLSTPPFTRSLSLSLPPSLPQPLPYLDKTETITLFIFIFDYLLRVVTVHAVPQRLIYWDGRRINEDHTVRRSPSIPPFHSSR